MSSLELYLTELINHINEEGYRVLLCHSFIYMLKLVAWMLFLLHFASKL